MRQHFLCPNHRQWLKDNLQAAHSHFADCQETGIFYQERGLPEQALPYLGCAFETAELLLNQTHYCGANQVLSFTASALSLSRGFQQLGLDIRARDTLQQAITRLCREMPSAQTRQYRQVACLDDCLQALSLGLQSHPQASASGSTGIRIH